MLNPKAYESELATKRQANEALIEGAHELDTTSGDYRAEAYRGLAR
jgi:hypothetical protein